MGTLSALKCCVSGYLLSQILISIYPTATTQNSANCIFVLPKCFFVLLHTQVTVVRLSVVHTSYWGPRTPDTAVHQNRMDDRNTE